VEEEDNCGAEGASGFLVGWSSRGRGGDNGIVTLLAEAFSAVSGLEPLSAETGRAAGATFEGFMMMFVLVGPAEEGGGGPRREAEGVLRTPNGGGSI